MAMPGHSPPHIYQGPGSPTRALNGHGDAQLPPSMYGPPRAMLPPSPQHYQHRFQTNPIPAPSTVPPSNTYDSRNIAPPHKRPGSSMSISSMLGGEPERNVHDTYGTHASQASSQHSTAGTSMAFGGAMSPPQQPTKPGYQDYGYRGRARTPDRVGFPTSTVLNRQRSSSSGTTLQRPEIFHEPPPRATSITPATTYKEPQYPGSYGSKYNGNFEQEERARRTSLSGILQRPSSQPQPGAQTSQSLDIFRSQPAGSTSIDRIPQAEIPKQNGVTSLYDTRPPGFNPINKATTINNPSPPQPPVQSMSPENRRASLNGIQNRGLASILNEPNILPPEVVSQKMARQDSARSQSERSILGDHNKFRAYSPFASSFSGANAPGDSQGRKGSDELSQHRAILGLAADSKRGRYSPMPQAVQGAQAQTPVPDAGIRTERGRVFSGIGSGIGSTPTPGGLSSSPFKKDDGPMRLSEDNLKNFSRSTPGVKRPRKARGEDGQADSDALNGEKPSNGSRKKNKQQHNYKAELEEMGVAGGLLRRNTPLSGLNTIKRTATPVTVNSLDGTGYQPQQRNMDIAPVFKPRKTIKVASIFTAAATNTRRHLGNFTYRPKILQTDVSRSNKSKFDVSITPNLLPSFTDAEHINCSYTIHVPRIWLQARERGLICAEQHLWGSGVYTDDSDPVAAVMHAGFLKANLGDDIDIALLSTIIQEQNPKIEFSTDLKVPNQPQEIEPGKDLNITVIVLPLLAKYEGSTRFGVRSRTWPEGFDKTQHDGVSFGILGIEFVDVGTEEIRVGRTGKGRRERLRMDLEARRRGLEIQRQRIEMVKKKQLDQLRLKRKSAPAISVSGNMAIPRSVPPSGLSISYIPTDIDATINSSVQIPVTVT